MRNITQQELYHWCKIPGQPCNTLIWQCEFPDIDSAYKTLDFFNGDEAHEALLRKQESLFKQVKIEFYKNLEF